MNERKPILYVFTISHFCEKARWALDFLSIDYQLSVVAPGTHLQIANKLGLKRGSTPFLQTANGVIQGSDAIIDWAESQSTSLTLSDAQNQQTISEIESRLDEKLGVHIRRWFYSEAIIEQPNLVKPIFLRDISVWEKLKFSIKWPVIKKLMIKRMDLGREQGSESFEIVKQELAWLDQLIKNSNFLNGEKLSRADITAAALLAPAIHPPNHPTSQYINLPPRVKEQTKELAQTAVWPWVEEIYTNYRR